MNWLDSWHVPHEYGALLQRRHDGVQQLLQTERCVALRGTRGPMHTRLPGDVAATIAQMDSVLGSSLSAEQATLYGQLDAALRNRTHAFVLTGLTANTQYEYEARSISLAGGFSPMASGLFRTRLEPDLRVAVGTNLDIQTTPSAATASRGDMTESATARRGDAERANSTIGGAGRKNCARLELCMAL